MAKMTPQKREEMETLIYNFFSAFDKTETNTKHYQDMFSKMSDAQFNKWFKDFLIILKHILYLIYVIMKIPFSLMILRMLQRF